MAAKNIAFEPLRAAIKAKNFSPIYIVHGEEGYFIDTLVNDFENVLPIDEREFNLNVLYAPRINMEQVPEICHRFPMMSDFQIVILKEAQSVRATDLNILIKYISNPSPSTILVIAGRGDKIKGDFFTAAKKSDNVTIFEPKKIYDSELPNFVGQFVKERGLNIELKALLLLTEFIGSDLSRLYNEIGKLTEILGPGAMITPEAIERHIGFSKQFNAFEFVEALSVKDARKAFRIADYFRANPKAVPMVLVTAAIFVYFSDLLTLYFLPDKSDRAAMASLGIKWDIQYKKYAAGKRNYNAYQVIEIIRAIRAFDRMCKGRDSRRNEHDLLHELIYHILTAPGNLYPNF